MDEYIEQPDIDAQLLYMSLKNNEPTVVRIEGTRRKYKIRWLKHGQLDRLTRLLLHPKTADKETTDKETTGSEVMDEILRDSKLACRAAAIIILDGYWKLKFNYWWLWRWFYYIRQYDDIQLQPILQEGKKKVPVTQFYMTTISLTEAKDSLMRMRQKEVEATLLAQSTAQRSPTASSDSGS